MAGIAYFYINLILNIYILIAVYYYCIKKYGIKVTIITNLSLSSLVLILMFTGAYPVADLESDLPETELLVTDPIPFLSSLGKISTKIIYFLNNKFVNILSKMRKIVVETIILF